MINYCYEINYFEGSNQYYFMNQEAGKYLMIGGIIILFAGILIYFFHDQFKWFGNLPGDIKVRSENTRFYFPIVTMIVISIVVTLVINIIRKIF